MFVTLLYQIVLITCSFLFRSQTCELAWYTQKYDSEVVKLCNTAAAIQEMTPLEKEVVLVTNLVRFNPALFAENVLRPFLRSCDKGRFFDSSGADVKSLYADLAKTPPMQLLQVHPLLNQTATSHAEYCERTGHMGHNNMLERWQRIKNELGHISAGENCSYVTPSSNTALYHVLNLLIDADVPGYGHRYTLLRKSYQYIGVSVRPFPGNKFCMVQNFSLRHF